MAKTLTTLIRQLIKIEMHWPFPNGVTPQIHMSIEDGSGSME